VEKSPIILTIIFSGLGEILEQMLYRETKEPPCCLSSLALGLARKIPM
jgi:hypothetical protein